jgi:sulfur carrier protein ThiS
MPDNMKVTVKIYGTLCQHVPDYKRTDGLELEMPVGATVKDLLALLRISQAQGVLVIMEGRVLNVDSPVRNGALVNVMQAVGGG